MRSSSSIVVPSVFIQQRFNFSFAIHGSDPCLRLVVWFDKIPVLLYLCSASVWLKLILQIFPCQSCISLWESGGGGLIDYTNACVLLTTEDEVSVELYIKLSGNTVSGSYGLITSRYPFTIEVATNVFDHLLQSSFLPENRMTLIVLSVSVIVVLYQCALTMTFQKVLRRYKTWNMASKRSDCCMSASTWNYFPLSFWMTTLTDVFSLMYSYGSYFLTCFCCTHVPVSLTYISLPICDVWIYLLKFLVARRIH